MRALRWTGASLLSVVGGLLGLIGLLLCVTLIGLPLGIPVLFLAKRLMQTAGQLVVPKAVRHPVEEIDKRGSRAGTSASKGVKRLGRKVPVPQRASRSTRLRRKLHIA